MKQLFLTVLFLFGFLSLSAQPGGHRSSQGEESWQVVVNEMNPDRRERITQTVESLQEQGGASRSVIGSILLAAGQTGLTSLVEITATEVAKLVTLRKTQKQEWQKMIDRECTYNDSIASIKGLQDFYSETSRLGALDPSNMNFDGISVRGSREGREVLFLSCHIDDERLDHLFQHSKFYLVIDTLAFYPYACHLPNLSANGIHLKDGETTDRNNHFSYDERNHLSIGMELSLSSSWINEAIIIQKDVELGRFQMKVNIPSGTEVYTYSRSRIDRNRQLIASGKAPEGVKLDTSYVNISGDCFVVPRSYMPISGTESMWGTGEYRMKVVFRESCQFSKDLEKNQKMKHWKRDYRQLRKMQKKNSGVGNYFTTLWRQNGNTMVKSIVKSTLNSGVSQAGLTGAGAGAGGGTGSKKNIDATK